MVEVVAENYHNIWAKKKKLELESKGEPGSRCPLQVGEGAGMFSQKHKGRAKELVISHFLDPRWWQSPSAGTI